MAKRWTPTRSRTTRTALGLALALAAVTVAGTPAVPAAATASRTLEATFTTGIANGWVRVERWNDNDPGFAPEAYPVHLLCGGAADIPTIHDEHTGPSDGVVFIRSCGSTRSVGSLRGNVLLATLDHLELGWAQSAMARVESWLR